MQGQADHTGPVQPPLPFSPISGSNVPSRSRGTFGLGLAAAVRQHRLGSAAIADIPAAMPLASRTSSRAALAPAVGMAFLLVTSSSVAVVTAPLSPGHQP
jgi:hypothetical protein